MKKTLLLATAALSLLTGAAPLAARAPAPAEAVPLGRLSDAARPTAYRIDLTVLPEGERFTGHAEIDVTLARPGRTLYLHGLDLAIRRAVATRAGAAPVSATATQVAASGVLRVDFAAPLPAGRVTLAFDYSAPFKTGSEGLYRAKVGDDWYAWTQMEATDARRVFPGFDEPGFKTPFTLGITARTGQKVFANTPELSATPAGAGMTRHVFAPSRPLPTYLVALAVGPFDVVEGVVPANAVRPAPLPYRVIATRGQAARMTLAATEGPRILALHERYFGSPYPFEKLDQIASPVMSGAMENAGLIAYNDTLLLLDPDAPASQRRGFGTVVAHEQAHQWFGDLVTPTWWTDIWLNESFAEWAGNRVGEIWQPGLGTDVSQLAEALVAMSTDSLPAGRPIRQPIERTEQIPTAFDSMTYQKGGQVLTMVERYLGEDKFRRGVRTHLDRFRYGSASADDFFASMAQGSGDPGIVKVFRSFVTQTGVPVVSIRGDGAGWTLRQERYRPIGVAPATAQTWAIPVCARQGDVRSCTLLDAAQGSLRLNGSGLAVPNADGAGYWRYSLDDAGWAALMAQADRLPAREAMAAGDSLWADFAAGRAGFARVLAGGETLARHPERLAALSLAGPLGDVAQTILSPAAQPGYRALLTRWYRPRFAALGLDPARGAYAAEEPARSQLRQSLVALLALEAEDPALRRQLATAAGTLLGGDAGALDPAYRSVALAVGVAEGGVPFMNRLRDALVASDDPLFRQQAVGALAYVTTPETTRRALELANDPRLQSTERLRLAFAMATRPLGRDAMFALLQRDFAGTVANVPAFARSRVPTMFASYCDASKLDAVAALFRPNMKTLGGGELEVRQTLDSIRQCVALKQAKGAEIETALASR